jgi:probable HAF family extracellular repeat protein
MRRYGLLRLVLLTVLLPVTVAAQAASYTFTTIAVPFPGALYTDVLGINNRGQIVGLYLVVDSGGAHYLGFLDDGGIFSTLDVPGNGGRGYASFTSPEAINDHGQIVGFYGDTSGRHGFLYEGGVFSTLDVPGASETLAHGINNHGQIVGEYIDSGGGFHGFLDDGGVFITLDVPFSGARNTEAQAINDSGQIVGAYVNNDTEHGFLYSGGVFTPLDVPGASYTYARGINNLGQIVGSYLDSSHKTHGFLYEGGMFSTFDVSFPGAQYTALMGINDLSQIVGIYCDTCGPPYSFVATPGIEVTIDIKPGSDPAPINPKSQGVIPVAILTTDTFDATTVNAATIRFGKTGTEAAIVRSALEDVDGDGDTDLLLNFNTQDTGIQCGDTSASLTGETSEGQPIQGSDAIVTTGCKK